MYFFRASLIFPTSFTTVACSLIMTPAVKIFIAAFSIIYFCIPDLCCCILHYSLLSLPDYLVLHYIIFCCFQIFRYLELHCKILFRCIPDYLVLHSRFILLHSWVFFDIIPGTFGAAFPKYYFAAFAIIFSLLAEFYCCIHHYLLLHSRFILLYSPLFITVSISNFSFMHYIIFCYMTYCILQLSRLFLIPDFYFFTFQYLLQAPDCMNC